MITLADGTYDVETIRADFPALDQEVGTKPLVYLDNAATTQKPDLVLDVMDRYYERDNANVHRGIHELSRRATEAYEGARAKVAESIHASDASEVIWTRGTTESINLVAQAWGRQTLEPGDEILLSVLEHHSNLVPWQLTAAATRAQLRYIEIDDEGEWILDDLPSLVTGRTRIVALSHVSNALGTINPVERVTAYVREHAPEAVILLDGAQALAHLDIDVQALGIDAYAFSGHKAMGPTGIGGLWARRDFLERMEPWQGGGEMISVVERESSTWAAVPHKFEAGTPNIAGAVGMGAAIDYIEAIGKPAIRAHEHKVIGYAIEQLTARFGERIRIWGPSDLDRRSGVVSFSLDFAHPHDIATIVDAEGVAIRAGHHCAQLVMKRYGVPATARASFCMYNTTGDVDRLVDALGEVEALFG
ncbi:MAG: SufS family cysteine desulfurase [Longimicrobiales bacterium]|nr:SufS family cysteine desulfurase [Longimicrobiales bacterium]